MGPSEAHDVDRHLGAMIRAKRKAAGMSQTALAKAIGVTFQQVQKYESGTSRVTVHRLFEIAAQLRCDPCSFIVGAQNPDHDAAPSDLVSSFLASRKGIELVKLYMEASPTVRTRLLSLIRAVATEAP